MQLSLIQPDFESIRSQLEATLTNYSAWRDLLPTGTGRTLTDWIAAVGANDQYAIEHAFRESFRTARLDSSILAQAILLGVRLSRKRPCSAQVTLSKPTTATTLTIPAFTSFAGNNSSLFNRDAITLIGNTPVTVTLFEGVPFKKSINGDGTPYQMFVSEEDGFTVSDVDVEVTLNDVVIERSTRGLWRKPNTDGYQDSTTPTGQILLTFGGDGYGSIPQTTDRLVISYVTTRGSLGQDAALAGDTVVCNDFRDVTGTAITGLSGGGDQKEPIFYRKLGPQLFAAREAATTEEEFNAVAAAYPGVIDARVLGQRNIAPSDVRWMNMVQVSLLTATPWTGADWDAFDAWFRERCTYPVRAFRKDPVPVVIDISADVFCQGRADLNLTKAAIEAQIQELFKPRPGLIDNNIYLSDIHAAIKGSESAVEYADIATPVDDVIVSVKAPSPLTLTAGVGTLPAGQYSYAVTAVTALGETLATNFTSVVVEANGGVTITWPAVAQATSYNIYGRTPLVLGRLATIPAGTLSFTDNGSVTPTTGLPTVNGAGHRYPKLGTLSIRVQYTNRNFYNLGNLR
jgi:hypothetical protein